jgi:ABC-type transporter MlaC component
MLRQDFDMDGITRFVLGPYWRTASPDQQQEFRALLENHIMYSHGRRLAETGGGNFRVTGSRTDPNGVVVVTGDFVTPQGARNEVDVQLSSASLMGVTGSRTSLSIMSAWYRASVPRSHRSWQTMAGNSKRC